MEEKYKLLKYLCMALPYGVIGAVPHYDENGKEALLQGKITGFNERQIKFEYLPNCTDDIGAYNWFDIDLVKLYLRPMASMTEKEKKGLLKQVVGKKGLRYFYVMDDGTIDNNDAAEQDLNNFNFHWVNFSPESVNCYIDWLLARHFDFIGLIPIDSAIEVTENNNPYKD